MIYFAQTKVTADTQVLITRSENPADDDWDILAVLTTTQEIPANSCNIVLFNKHLTKPSGFTDGVAWLRRLECITPSGAVYLITQNLGENITLVGHYESDTESGMLINQYALPAGTQFRYQGRARSYSDVPGNWYIEVHPSKTELSLLSIDPKLASQIVPAVSANTASITLLNNSVSQAAQAISILTTEVTNLKQGLLAVTQMVTTVTQQMTQVAAELTQRVHSDSGRMDYLQGEIARLNGPFEPIQTQVAQLSETLAGHSERLNRHAGRIETLETRVF